MTVNDFLDRVGNEEDLDKVMLWSDGDKGWSNIKIEITEGYIYIKPDRCNSPFSSDN